MRVNTRYINFTKGTLSIQAIRVTTQVQVIRGTWGRVPRRSSSRLFCGRPEPHQKKLHTSTPKDGIDLGLADHQADVLLSTPLGHLIEKIVYVVDSFTWKSLHAWYCMYIPTVYEAIVLMSLFDVCAWSVTCLWKLCWNCLTVLCYLPVHVQFHPWRGTTTCLFDLPFRISMLMTLWPCHIHLSFKTLFCVCVFKFSSV